MNGAIKKKGNVVLKGYNQPELDNSEPAYALNSTSSVLTDVSQVVCHYNGRYWKERTEGFLKQK